MDHVSPRSWQPACAAVAIAAAVIVAGSATISCAGAAATADGVRFFESEIRPILAENCLDCHGARKSEAGLRLDRREAVLRGSDFGPIVVPGDPAGSRLLQAVRHELPDARMPKDADRLPDAAIALLEQWIAIGLPWGEEAPEPDGPTPAERAANHWAFKPPVKREPPAVVNDNWVRNPIDRFILAKLEAQGMEPSPEADRPTLARRFHVGLTGLPPTREELDAFLSDPSPTAVDDLIDRLLASPRHGERWARYWLDVARYADTKGYAFQEERRFPYSYTYRDWVIAALNSDMPYDRFVTYQLAADHEVAKGDDPRHLAAMGFLTLGRRFLNRESLIIDDRIDVVTRGLLGLTVGCARCHDHKSDPIPTADYYSLYGVFASSTEPDEKPLLGNPEESAGYAEFAKGLAEREGRRDDYLVEQWRAARGADQIAKSLDALAAAWKGGKEDVDKAANAEGISSRLVIRWKEAIENAAPESEAGRMFTPWRESAGAPEDAFAAQFSAFLARPPADGEAGAMLGRLREKLGDGPIASIEEINRAYADTIAAVLEDTAVSTEGSDAPTDRLRAELEQVDGNWPTAMSKEDLARLYHRGQRERLRQLESEIEAYRATADGAPARGMVLVDKPNPTDTPIFLRGNENRPGDVVPRRFLGVLAGTDREPFREGSGRSELARAIVDPANPVTARVIVNRVWMHHFGSPLVRTPSDFGVQTPEPLHLDLLDFLAVSLVENGWSLKALHRLILGSATYRQSADGDPADIARDPDNDYLARKDRLRLDFEGMRDAVLMASGALDLKMGGRGIDIVGDVANGRRTVYAFIERQNLPGLFRTFDFASPDTHSPARFETTVPQQALFLLNSPFMLHHADLLAGTVGAEAPGSDEDRIRWLYSRVLARDPRPEELAAALGFVAASAAGPLEGWSFGSGRVDPTFGTVEFTPLPHWTGSAWQGGPDLPDPERGWVTLHAEGGHPGEAGRFDAIRRWTSSVPASVAVSGTLTRPSGEGDGVRLRVLSKQAGLLGTWEIGPGGSAEFELRDILLGAGDTLDFVVDSMGNTGWDGFRSRIIVRASGDTSGNGEAPVLADSVEGFSGPMPERNPWAQLAQVLLCSNEFAFVD